MEGMEKIGKKSSDAKIKANAKYNKKKFADGTNKRLNVVVKTEISNAIDNYCTNNNISKAKFVAKSAMYIINNNVDINDIGE